MTFNKFKSENNLSLHSVVPLDERRWVEIYHNPSDGALCHIYRERLLPPGGIKIRWHEMKDEE